MPRVDNYGYMYNHTDCKHVFILCLLYVYYTIMLTVCTCLSCVLQYVDKDFDLESAHCKDLENAVRDFTKNLDHLLTNLRVSLQCERLSVA